MVLTKKKSFSANNTNINRSKKINRVSQEGRRGETSKKTLQLFIGFNDYYKIDDASYKKELKSGEFYIQKTGPNFYLKKFSETHLTSLKSNLMNHYKNYQIE